MTTLSAFSSLSSISIPNSNSNFSSSSCISLPIRFVRLQSHSQVSISSSKIPKFLDFPRLTKIRSLAEDETETLIPAAEDESVTPNEEEAQTLTTEPVSVPVSPSDVLTMFFQAEGSMNEAAIPAVAKALEETDNISDLKVQVVEGIASVELTKQTTVQATGVASSLVEIIQGSGFKLQTLNLSFEDEEDIN